MPVTSGVSGARRRPYDIAVLGASGTYGFLAVQQLRRLAPPSTRILLAGRDVAKLRTLHGPCVDDSSSRACDDKDPAGQARSSSSSSSGGGGDGDGGHRKALAVTLYEHPVDMHDRRALDQLAVRVHVVASALRADAAGGADEVIAACVASGTHYTDLQAKPGALLHVIRAFDGPARAAGALLAPGCGFDYAVPDAAGAAAEAAFRGLYGCAPSRVAKVFGMRPGPQGLVLSTKWITALLPVRGSKQRQQPPPPPKQQQPQQQQQEAPHGAAHSAATPALTPTTGADTFEVPPPPRGAWLSYSAPLRAWTMPFPMGAKADRLLLAWRQQSQQQRQHQQQHQQQSQEQPQARGPHGAALHVSEQLCMELDSRIVLPLPALTVRRLVLVMLAPLLLPAFLLLSLCLLPAAFVLSLAVIAAWPRSRALLVRAAPLLPLGLFTSDDATAQRALDDLQFDLVITATGRRLDAALNAVSEPKITAPAAAAVAGGHGPSPLATGAGAGGGAASGGTAGAVADGPAAGAAPAELQLWVSGPARGQWRNLTSACLSLAALRLLQEEEEEEEARHGALTTLEAGSEGGGGGMPYGGVVTPAQLLLGGPSGSGWFWSQLEVAGLGVYITAVHPGCSGSARQPPA